MIINRHTRRKIEKIFSRAEYEAQGDIDKLDRLLTERLTSTEYRTLERALSQEAKRQGLTPLNTLVR